MKHLPFTARMMSDEREISCWRACRGPTLYGQRLLAKLLQRFEVVHHFEVLVQRGRNKPCFLHLSERVEQRVPVVVHIEEHHLLLLGADAVGRQDSEHFVECTYASG